MSTQKITLPISGMNCASCVNTIEKALQKTEGVVNQNVSLINEEANIEFDTDKTSEEKIVEAINKTGYTVEKE